LQARSGKYAHVKKQTFAEKVDQLGINADVEVKGRGLQEAFPK
jgi:hypothetical protein